MATSARPRAHSEIAKTAHSISLKVLRLSKPSLSHQFPLAKLNDDLDPPIDRRAALASPSSTFDDEFLLSPLLTLPSSFGTTHVGETFSCTLCANLESHDPNASIAVENVHVTAEMQSPSGNVPLDLESAHDSHEESLVTLQDTLQRIVRFELREEGSHVLAVTVTYAEKQVASDGQAESNRIRTFRKLYQFVAQQLLNVRTKVQPFPHKPASTVAAYTLEAQLENRSNLAVTLDSVVVIAKEGFKTKSLNIWDMPSEDNSLVQRPLLNPGDILQVAFLLVQMQIVDSSPSSASTSPDGRVVVGQLSIQWRGPMGELGSLRTGWLSAKRG